VVYWAGEVTWFELRRCLCFSILANISVNSILQALEEEMDSAVEGAMAELAINR